MKKLIVVFLILSNVTYADSWSFPKKLAVDKFIFGDITIIRKSDSRESNQYPEWSIEIREDKKLLGLYKGISFDEIFSIHDAEVFVGVSNSGLPNTALVIFDSKGRIRILRDHNQKLFDYCSWSVIIDRKWYDQDKPDLKYETVDDIEGLFINSCSGERINILDKL